MIMVGEVTTFRDGETEVDTLSRAFPLICDQRWIHRARSSFDCLPDESDQSINHFAGLDRFPCPPTVPVIAVPGTTRCTATGTVHAADTPPTNCRGRGRALHVAIGPWRNALRPS